MFVLVFWDSFGEDYGVIIVDGLMVGLFVCVIVVIGVDGNVVYMELVLEIV